VRARALWRTFVRARALTTPCRKDNGALPTLVYLALILVYTCLLTIKTRELSPDACQSYGFGASSKGFFLFFIFFGFSMLVFHLVFEAIAIVYHIRMQKKLRRLRYHRGRLVELPSVAEEEFAHLPGLQPSPCFHLFLSREPPSGPPNPARHLQCRAVARQYGCSRSYNKCCLRPCASHCRARAPTPDAWPLCQDVCKLIKSSAAARSARACASSSTSKTSRPARAPRRSDHSRCILVFAMPVNFEDINCVKELTTGSGTKEVGPLALYPRVCDARQL
jgi:hypothetical protein